MSSMRLWILLLLIMVCACGGSTASEQSEAAREGAKQIESSGSEVRADPVDESTDAAVPETPKEVVIALIEAFQAGDQDGVEALWARDGGTWRNSAGFQARAAYFQKAEFDLDPDSITMTSDQQNPQVVVRAKQDGQEYLWSFMVIEIDGQLRAGGVESRVASLP